MPKNTKKHGRTPMLRRGAKKPARENNRHHFQQSAVLEFCICGERKTDPIHIKRRAPKPVPKEVVQVGIEPDTAVARMRVRDLLHWKFVEKVDDGVWHVETIRPWPVNVDFSASITLQDGTEIEVNLEWP